jgi:DNA-binding NtrC family response regulator
VPADTPTLIGTGPALAAIRRTVELVAPTAATVLLLGETGAGKELVARAVHAQSKRACAPECPVGALFIESDVPAKWTSYVQLNADRVRVLKPAGARVTEKR